MSRFTCARVPIKIKMIDKANETTVSFSEPSGLSQVSARSKPVAAFGAEDGRA
jgi:hypothetical protein